MDLGKLVHDSDQAVAEAAIAALGKIGDENATKILAKAKDKITGSLRIFVLDAYLKCADKDEMLSRVDIRPADRHLTGVVSGNGGWVVEIANPSANLPVGTLQAFLDIFIRDGGCSKIDYVHGTDVVIELGSQKNNVGFYLPAMDKSDLFKTVILDGALPRKTFSMGEAEEKRFYMECRKIL